MPNGSPVFAARCSQVSEPEQLSVTGRDDRLSARVCDTRMPKAVAVGFSHLMALKVAQDARERENRQNIDIDFMLIFPNNRYNPWVDAKDGRWIFNENLRSDLVSAVETDKPTAVLVSAWSNQHFTFSCFSDPRPFDFVLPREASGEVAQGAEAVPADLIFAMVKENCAPYFSLLSHVRSLTDRQVVMQSAPPPIDDVLAIPGGTSDPRLDEKVKELGVAPASLRRKFWRVCETIFQEACKELGVTFLPAPLETFDKRGFRRREYWSTDWIHANADYGELVLRQLDEVLSPAGSSR